MADRRRDQRGSAALGTVIGVGCLMVMLGVSINVLLGLWTRSTIDSVSYDATRTIATAPAGTPRRAAADAAFSRARDVLGPVGEQVCWDLESGEDDAAVVVRVRAPGVSVLPRVVSGAPTVGDLDRRIVVRAEPR